MMQRAAERLTAFLIEQNTIRQEDAELYTFGMQAGLEFMSCLFVSLGAAILLKRVIEFFVFLVVFIPIRAYAGGFHFERFFHCFLGSCTLIITVIWLSGREWLSLGQGFVGALVLLGLIALIPPAEHKNREVTEAEKIVFRKMLLRVLVGVGIGAAGFYLVGSQRYLNLVFLTLLSAVVSMVMGKVGYCQNM